MKYDVITYIILSFAIALFLSRQTDKKILSFIMILYIFAQPALTYAATIDLPGLPFDLQPNRILLFIMIAFLIWPLLVKSNVEQINFEKPAFEKFLYLYVSIVIISFIFRMYTGNLSAKGLILSFQNILLFIAVYHVSKREVTSSVLTALLNALVIISILASVIAIYQILIDSSFLKLHPPRSAFGGFIRSSAMFNSEYMFGYLINFAIIVAFLKYRGRPFIYFLLPLLIIALITTFHRMSWIIFIVCSSHYFFLAKRYMTAALLYLAISVLLSVISISYFANPDFYFNIGKGKMVQSFTQRRLSSQNITGRMQIQYAIIKALRKNVMGLNHKQYVEMMAEIGRMKNVDDKPTGVHNGYLGLAAHRGLPTMISFMVFLISMLIYFFRHITPKRPENILPFAILLIWSIANLSNFVSSFRLYITILIAIICGSFVSMYNKNFDINTFLLSEET